MADGSLIAGKLRLVGGKLKTLRAAKQQPSTAEAAFGPEMRRADAFHSRRFPVSFGASSTGTLDGGWQLDSRQT